MNKEWCKLFVERDYQIDPPTTPPNTHNVTFHKNHSEEEFHEENFLLTLVPVTEEPIQNILWNQSFLQLKIPTTSSSSEDFWANQNPGDIQSPPEGSLSRLLY